MGGRTERTRGPLTAADGAPPKTTDPRSFSGTATTGRGRAPDILAAIVREAIEAHRDPEVHRQALAREQAECQAIRERLNRGTVGLHHVLRAGPRRWHRPRCRSGP